MLKRSIIFLLLFLSSISLFAQIGEDRDSLVRLISADQARLVEIDGKEYRKVVGNARFLHNNTYLLCDSAYWNVADNYIDAIGNVKIMQENTLLTGDSLKYIINQNLACLRGNIVQLIDKDSNILRTENLDYNTRDSVATFFAGASMKDKDGNVIESDRGIYESPKNLFTFIKNVQMFSDSMFFISDTLKYNSKDNIANFSGRISGWYEKNNITARKGQYNRAQEIFNFEKNVHILTEDYEVWCEKLFYDRNKQYSHLQNKIEILDTLDNSIVLGDDLYYWDSPRRVEITKNPVVVILQENNDEIDSLFLTSDILIYYQQKMFEIDSALIAQAKQRYESTLVDPVVQIRKQSGGGTGSNENGSSNSNMSGGNSQMSLQGNKKGGGEREMGLQGEIKGGGNKMMNPKGNKEGGIHNINSETPKGKHSGNTKSNLSSEEHLNAEISTIERNSRKNISDSLTDDIEENSENKILNLQGNKDNGTKSPTIISPHFLSHNDSLSINFSGIVKDSLMVIDSAVRTNSSMVANSSFIGDSLTVADSLMITDSLNVIDTAATLKPVDTTAVSFVEAYHNVKIYKSDIQISCDSLLFTGLDSIARLFTNPVIWYQIDNQVTGDSMQFVLKNNELKKGYVLSNAFVIAEETPDKYYHQIKSPEMVGYFDKSTLSRFDALGGVNAIFYLQEDSVVTTMNQKDCRIFSVLLKEGSLQKTYNYETAKNDAYPVYNLPEDKQKLKNFNWRGDERFPDRFALTDAVIRPSRRRFLIPSSRFPKFIITNKYFPDYIENIMFEIDKRKPLIWIKRQ